MRDKRNALFRLFLLCIMAVSLLLCGREHCRKLQQKEQQQDLILIKEKALAEEEPEDKAETAGREEPGRMEESDGGKAPDTEQGVPLMLEKYREHPAISLDTLYEERVYDIVAVFRSQVYKEEEDVFKYYQFYQADTPEEFEYFYTNIKELSLYDTGVTAEYGDRFLTLSTCAYHVEDGRFVVVAKLKE